MSKNDTTPYVRKSTALLIALICVAAGFGFGYIVKSLDDGGNELRKVTLSQPQNVEAEPEPSATPAPDDVILRLRQVVAAEPTNADAWAHLGHRYFDLNRFQQAVDAYKKHLELKPDNADVWTDMGVMYRRLKQPDEAVKCFDRARAVNPTHEQCRFNKGVVLIFDLHDREGGVSAWKELLKINPSAKTPDGRPIEALVEQFSAPPTPAPQSPGAGAEVR